MKKKTEEFTNEMIESIKNISRDNAIRYGNSDKELKVTITSTDIKRETSRTRLDDSVRQSMVNKFKSEGMDAEISDNNIHITVQPMLAEKDSYTIQELKERESVINELNTREAYILSNS